MLHLSTVEPATLELLRKLQSLPILKNTRLVGGTALALQFGHRKSVDLDFFGRIDADSFEEKVFDNRYIEFLYSEVSGWFLFYGYEKFSIF